ncbi:MAG: glycosyl hydrolase family 28-related protein, partial [Terracidiphilus sp.]
MKSFDSMRRDFLRTGSFGMAAAAIPAVSLAAAVQDGATATAAAQASQGIFDVRKYGAAGDGKTLDTGAVNRAIEAAAAAGGGVVVFPAGSYLCFSIHLKSYVNLHLLQGSAIVAADSPREGEQ